MDGILFKNCLMLQKSSVNMAAFKMRKVHYIPHQGAAITNLPLPYLLKEFCYGPWRLIEFGLYDMLESLQGDRLSLKVLQWLL